LATEQHAEKFGHEVRQHLLHYSFWTLKVMKTKTRDEVKLNEFTTVHKKEK